MDVWGGLVVRMRSGNMAWAGLGLNLGTPWLLLCRSKPGGGNFMHAEPKELQIWPFCDFGDKEEGKHSSTWAAAGFPKFKCSFVLAWHTDNAVRSALASSS